MLGASALYLDDVMDATCGNHIPLCLAALTQWIGLEFGGTQLAPLAAVHQLDI